MIKKFLLYFILILVSFVFAMQSFAEERYLFHGYAEINEELKEDPEILSQEKGQIEKGTKVSMVVSNILNTEKSEEGDEFFAEITNDIKTEKGVVIPAGSIAHGTISEIVGAKRFNRDANITLQFDYIATLDGREIPINATMTTKRNPVHNAAVVTAKHAGYTAAGGAIGGVVALHTLGLAAAVASHGYTVAGGAAIGAVAGLGVAMSKKGNQVLLAPGDAINVKIIDAVNLPVFKESALVEEEIRSDSLLVNVTSVRFEKDPFGEPNTITLGISIVNKTNRTYSTFDMALINENRAVYYASPFGDTELWFKQIPPNSRIAGKVSFSVDNPKQKLWLVFFDNYYKQPVVKISLNNARREIELKKGEKKGKKKK